MIDRNELLAQAGVRAVLGGKLIASAVPDLVAIFGGKCTVDPATNSVLLGGQPLDVAVAKLIEKRPHWRAQPDDTAAALANASRDQERTALEEQAKTGNATAQGKLFKLIGEAEYSKFAEQNGVRPGKAATVKADDGANANNGGVKKPSASNPWSGAGWSLRKQGELIKAVGVEKSARIAAAAGCKLGSTHPNAAYN